MILTAEFESTDCLPPRVLQELTVAIHQLYANWGINVRVCVDRVGEQEMYNRFWAWSAAVRAQDDWPKAPADAEVK